MFNISGLNALLRVIRDTGIRPTKLHILSGVSKPRHGLWIVTHKGLVEQEGYGISSLVEYNLKEAEMFTEDTVCKYIGLTVGQQEVCVFGIEAGDEEVIKMKTSLNTTVGNRQLCGEGCNDNKHEHKPLVVIAPVVVDEPIITESIVIEPEKVDAPEAPDFEYAQSLSDTGNKNEQKAALEEYARKFDIELNRGTKFDAMMVDFKEKFNA